MGRQTMSRLDLQAKYGRNWTLRRLLNAAIRAELPGGADILDLLDQTRRLKDRLSQLPDTAAKRGVADAVEGSLALIRHAVDQMAAEIRRRYDIAQRPDDNDIDPVDDAPGVAPSGP